MGRQIGDRCGCDRVSSVDEIRDGSVALIEGTAESLKTIMQSDPIAARLILFGLTSAGALALKDAEDGSVGDEIRCILKAIAAISAASAVSEGIDGPLGAVAGAGTLITLGAEAARDCIDKPKSQRRPIVIPELPELPPDLPGLPKAPEFPFVPPLLEQAISVTPFIQQLCILQALARGEDPLACVGLGT